MRKYLCYEKKETDGKYTNLRIYLKYIIYINVYTLLYLYKYKKKIARYILINVILKNKKKRLLHTHIEKRDIKL